MTEECVQASPPAAVIQQSKRFTGYIDYAARREKRKRFPRFTGFPRSEAKKTGYMDYAAGGRLKKNLHPDVNICQKIAFNIVEGHFLHT